MGRPLSDFVDAYRRDTRSVAELQADLVAKTRRCSCGRGHVQVQGWAGCLWCN